ncbi:methyl-accepting chemotaxis protein [Shewanella sp. WXL01]|uniref:Methyl-accepting chemotaxis protein n=2 Tax=Shewanella maritima TaxID=2520507 RepID=A0A411PMQ7_9GAMM|nr:methyl-accepting chemotaxis protein [Shewanella sp. WXL01]NKF50177.1 methyl-accepting chemotaxis protein [Shewanella sp. WXL01]QBF84771.1 methyl-accepting chemotaxis protein [Shewanella maritima]
MINNYKSWPLAKQIGSLALLLSVIVFSLMSLVSYMTSSQVLTDKATKALIGQMHGNSKLIELQYNSMLELARRNADILKVMYPGNFYLKDKRVKVLGVRAPSIYHEHELLNGAKSKVDRFAKLTSGNATMFVRDGDDFVRVSTSLRKPDGQRAIGTKLGKQHPGYKLLMQGKEYEGHAKLFGRDYMTVYRPIFDDNRQVIGIMFIGFDISMSVNQIQQTLKELTVEDTGFYMLISNSDYKIISHPQVTGDQEFDLSFLNGLDKQSAMQTETFNEFESPDGHTMVSYTVAVNGWNWTMIGMTKLSEFNDGSVTLLKVILGLAAVGIALISVLLFAVINKTTAPLAKLQTQMANLGAGDLSQQFDNVSAQSNNEIDQITLSTSKMAENLSELIHSLQQSVISLEAQANHGQENAELNGQEAQTLLGQTEQIATAIEEMSSSVREVADNASRGAVQSQQVDVSSREGHQQLDHVVHALEELSEQLDQSQTNIEKVTTESEAISKVTEVINGIAEQTNLLALNAAIEAARAGEQGRGFAVVADEVRSLAQRTQTSISEIGSTIGRLQAQVKLTAEQMQHCQQLGQRSAQQGETVNEQLSQINASIEELALFTTSIASATEQQSAVANDISSNLHSISTLAKDSHVRADMDVSSAKELAQMAKDIKQKIGVFKVS